MARRKNFISLLENPEDFSSLTPEQQDVVRSSAKILSDMVRDELDDTNRLPPVERIAAFDLLVQFGAVLSEKATELRDATIIEQANQMSRSETTKFIQQLSTSLCLSPPRIRQILAKYNLGKRGKSQSRKIASKLTREFLEVEYGEKGRTQTQIAEDVGCKSQTVSNYMKRYLKEDVESGMLPEDSAFFTRRGPKIKSMR